MSIALRPRTLAFVLLLFLGMMGGTAFAQAGLAGYWGQKITEDQPERGPGPEIGDYTGIPINEANRARADAWDAQKWEVVEHECDPHPADYAPRGPGDLNIWAEIEPFTQGIVAWHETLRFMLNQRTFYMDGRPHPSENAPHTWQGFSTGEWEGDMLKVTTTHLKEGWVRRNGLARSEKATLVEYFIRHGDFLTLVSDVEDPIYLTEPFVRTSNWILDLGGRLRGNYCIPSVEADHPEGYVAHHLPGENPWLTEFASRHGIPVEATRGGAETMYPEYQEKLAKMPDPPKLPKNNEKK
ncbi:MAG: hypothetical protein ABSA96_01180 [Candidatus Acidiferrales bacterium]|jgi:hypothetical protein